ncbi:Hsp20/alpha crystallin family protein [Aurantimonas sp. VKM B-3413]|uniref:Hsp20/alpha crystallin family protein n=1 Tax=Aurantimonas sp. VKM B-3413 TaxID=2779401 RepID=UPI001E2DBA92|nr:Hsp20/alpha crystallin family protein [Aurantimonas sp. VKM B-3413]MCB8839897.1 Hsp20/alpha crystallin family protein [Aurantimonas sp. VKM B-3413]
MADTATKLPVKTETDAPSATAATRAWSPFETLRGEMDRLFDMFGGRRGGPLSRGDFDLDFSLPKGMTFGAGTPAVDVAEKDGEYEITAELPGLDEKDVEVKVANGALTIKGEKKEEKEERQKDYYLSERRYGTFVRSFALPKGVDQDKIAARFAKGVLTVTLPKTPEAKAEEKKIEVKAA